MKTLEKSQLDCFLELPLIASSFIKIDKEYTCIHDDNDGNHDQCLKITLKKDSLGTEVFHLKTPTSPGLRFRNYAGGGSNLQVHNTLKVLIYASFDKELFLPGLERKKPGKKELSQNIEDILEGIIILPPEVFADQASYPHYFFEITSYLKIAIAVDGDTYVITEITTELTEQIEEETTRWNPESETFCLRSNCSRALYNALILLAIATKQSDY